MLNLLRKQPKEQPKEKVVQGIKKNEIGKRKTEKVK